MLPQGLIDALIDRLGADSVLTDRDALIPYARDWRGRNTAAGAEWNWPRQSRA